MGEQGPCFSHLFGKGQGNFTLPTLLFSLVCQTTAKSLNQRNHGCVAQLQLNFIFGNSSESEKGNFCSFSVLSLVQRYCRWFLFFFFLSTFIFAFFPPQLTAAFFILNLAFLNLNIVCQNKFWQSANVFCTNMCQLSGFFRLLACFSLNASLLFLQKSVYYNFQLDFFFRGGSHIPYLAEINC